MNPAFANVIQEVGAWSPQENANFLQSVEDTPEGQEIKQASAGSSDITRRVLRESSFVQHLQNIEPITADRMTRPVSSAAGDSPEIGVVICEMEPGSPQARSVPFFAGPTQNTFRGDIYLVRISKDDTPELYKNVDELALYKADIRALVTDNLLKDLDNKADYRYMATVKEIIGTSTTAVGPGGNYPYREVLGNVTRETYKSTLLPLMDATLHNGVFLMSRQTAVSFLGWGRDMLGGDQAERIAASGLSAMEKFEWFGVPHIATIKNRLIPDGSVFHFAPQNMLGKFFEYQAPTVYIKKERDIITIYAARKYGYSIGNEAAVAHTRFVNV